MKAYKGSDAEMTARLGTAVPPAGDCCRLGLKVFRNRLDPSDLMVTCKCEDACDYARVISSCALYGLELHGDIVKEAKA